MGEILSKEGEEEELETWVDCRWDWDQTKRG
jgi:hypothetical protein